MDWSLWGCIPWPVAPKEWKDGQGTNFQPLFIPGPSLTGCPGALPELSTTPGPPHPRSRAAALRPHRPTSLPASPPLALDTKENPVPATRRVTFVSGKIREKASLFQSIVYMLG